MLTSRRLAHPLTALTLLLWCLCLAAGCVTPASVPDRSTSTLPEPTLDRGFSSPGTAPTAPGEPNESSNLRDLLPPRPAPLPGFGMGR